MEHEQWCALIDHITTTVGNEMKSVGMYLHAFGSDNRLGTQLFLISDILPESMNDLFGTPVHLSDINLYVEVTGYHESLKLDVVKNKHGGRYMQYYAYEDPDMSDKLITDIRDILSQHTPAV